MLASSHTAFGRFAQDYVDDVVEEVCFAVLTAEVLRGECVSMMVLEANDTALKTHTTENVFLS